MTWEAFHRRGDVLNDVVREAGRRRDGILPTDVPGVSETFHDELDLLAALQLRWHTRLAGRIEGELAEQPLDLREAVVSAWRGAATAMPGMPEILAHYRAHPTDAAMAQAVSVATAKEHHMLAVMAGLTSRLDAERLGSERGAELEEQARAGLAPAEARTHAASNFLDRLKAALAA